MIKNIAATGEDAQGKYSINLDLEGRSAQIDIRLKSEKFNLIQRFNFENKFLKPNCISFSHNRQLQSNYFFGVTDEEIDIKTKLYKNTYLIKIIRQEPYPTWLKVDSFKEDVGEIVGNLKSYYPDFDDATIESLLDAKIREAKGKNKLYFLKR
ncbi:hypothetical protein HYU07_01175 [Candidatus Woesearchaeota archaeon]|nr:hypothetical protein [Candidatus Woesearchaeota archaeon]